MSTDNYRTFHDELKEKDYKIWLKMHGMKKDYINKHGTKDMSFLEEDSLLVELRRTKEWKTLAKQLGSVNRTIVELYDEYLENECPNCKLKKDKIIALKKEFGWQAYKEHIAKVVKCSRGYVGEFDIDRNGNVQMKPQRKKISSATRKKVINRDKNTCVLCGAKENLQIHHIDPVMGSYSKVNDSIDNLVTLCKKCHYLAHGGNYWGSPIYSKVSGGFWEWIKKPEKLRMWFILRDIQGIGSVTSDNIYKEFKSLENLKNADLNDLVEVKLVNETLAKRIKSRLRYY